MARVFNITRGSYFEYHVGEGNDGLVDVEALGLKGEEGVLVDAFSFSAAEKVSIMQCFQDSNHVYAFGHDPERSAFSVRYAVFLGQKCMKDAFKPGGAFSKAIQAYKDNRVSAHTEDTVKLTYGDGLQMSGIITALEVGVLDPQLNAVFVTITGNLMEMG